MNSYSPARWLIVATATLLALLTVVIIWAFDSGLRNKSALRVSTADLQNTGGAASLSPAGTNERSRRNEEQRDPSVSDMRGVETPNEGASPSDSEENLDPCAVGGAIVPAHEARWGGALIGIRGPYPNGSITWCGYRSVGADEHYMYAPCDPEGRFAITFVDPGHYIIDRLIGIGVNGNRESRSVGPVVVSVPKDCGSLDLCIPVAEQPSLAGVVVDALGNRIPRAKVVATRLSADCCGVTAAVAELGCSTLPGLSATSVNLKSDGVGGCLLRSTACDAQGRFSILGLCPGSWRIVSFCASSAGREVLYSETRSVEVPLDGPLALTIAPEVRVECKLTCADSGALDLTGAVLSVVRHDGYCQLDIATIPIDADILGERGYEIELTPGRYSIYVSVPLNLACGVDDVTVAPSPKIQECVIVLRKGKIVKLGGHPDGLIGTRILVGKDVYLWWGLTLGSHGAVIVPVDMRDTVVESWYKQEGRIRKRASNHRLDDVTRTTIVLY